MLDHGRPVRRVVPHGLRRVVLTVGLGALAVTATSVGTAVAQTPVPPSPTIAGAQFLQPNVNFISPTASTYNTSEETGFECPTGGPRADRSFWFRVRGTGGRLTFTTNFAPTVPDTIIFTYGPNTTPPAGAGACDDDVSSTNRNSETTIERSVAGATYHVSFGVCVNPSGTYCGVSDGRLHYAVIANDQREFADTLVNESRTNVGATVESDERPNCNGVAYGQTVWYRWVAPAKGRVTLAASSPSNDIVMSLYRGASTTSGECNDNSPTNPLRSEITTEVGAGEALLLQIGSKGGTGGGLSLSADFVQDDDADDDGYPQGIDCNDADAAIRPNAAEIPNNEVDENCDGNRAFDRDGDGVVAGPDCDDNNPRINPSARDIPGDGIDQDCGAGGPDADDDGYPPGADCNDANAAIRPNAAEVPNNQVDENCDKSLAFDRDGDGFVAGPDCNDNDPSINPKARDVPGDGKNQDCAGGSAPLLRQAGVIDVNGGLRRGITILRSFYATRVAAGSTVEVRCKGKWCQRRTKRTIRVTKTQRRMDVRRYLRGLRVPAGTVLELRVTRPEHRGEALRITMRRTKGPAKRRLCASPGKAFKPC